MVFTSRCVLSVALQTFTSLSRKKGSRSIVSSSIAAPEEPEGDGISAASSDSRSRDSEAEVNSSASVEGGDGLTSGGVGVGGIYIQGRVGDYYYYYSSLLKKKKIH